jgi:hypothetical protein
VSEQELADRGVNVVIYANHMLRAAYPNMRKVAETILANGRSLEADPLLAPDLRSARHHPGEPMIEPAASSPTSRRSGWTCTPGCRTAC